MKRLLIAIPSIILLVIVGVFAWLLLFFDANDYRDQISDAFKKNTGREITIAGDLETSFFPWIGIKTGAIEIANAPGFGEGPLAAIKGSNIHLKLMPLFSGEIEMETVVLDGVKANLVTMKNGKTNWEFAATGESKTAKEEDSSEDAGKALAALAIGGVQLKDASITWDDRQGGTKINLSEMNLETGAISFDSPIDVAFSTGFAMNGNEMTGKLKVDTDVKLAQSLQQVVMDGLKVDIDASGTTLDNGKLKTSLESDIAVDLASQLVSTDKIALAIDLAGGAAPIDPMEVTLESPMKMNLASMVIDMPTMKYSVPGSTGTGSLNLSNLDKPMPTVKLVLDTDSFDLRPWMATGAAQTGSNSLFTEELLFALVSIHSASAAAKSEPLDLPLDTIRQLDVDAGLTIGKVILEGLEATDVNAQLKAKKGIVRIEPMSAKVFGGTSTGMLQLDGNSSVPKFHITEQLEGVQIAQVMKYSMGKDAKDWITGVAVMNADIKTRGNDTAAITSGLNGMVDAKVKDGYLEGFSVRKMLQRANALLKGKPYVDDGSPNRTKILEMGTKTNLVNGVAVTDDIKILTPLADVTGSGKADLNTETLDYRLKMALSSGISEIDKAEYEKLQGRSLPLMISGSFDDPKFSLDLNQATRDEVKGKVEEKLQKKFGDKYGKELDMLFGK
jgi:AsmA protein